MTKFSKLIFLTILSFSMNGAEIASWKNLPVFKNSRVSANKGKFLTFPDSNKYAGLGKITIDIKFKPDVIRHCVLIRKTKVGTETGFQVFMNKKGKIGFQIKNKDGKKRSYYSKNKVKLHKWNRVICTWDQNRPFYNFQVMLNDVVSRASAKLRKLSNVKSNLTIGGLDRGNGKSGQYFSGQISSLLINDETKWLDISGKPDPAPVKMTGMHLHNQPGYVRSEFIYDKPPVAECHAPTIEAIDKNKLIAAWFGGTCEGHIDVGIWTATYENGEWQKPVCVVKGFVKDGVRQVIWNPLLFKHSNGTLYLFYKYGHIDKALICAYKTSKDNGKTWSKPVYPGKNLHGPSKNKPVELKGGIIYCPAGGDKMEFSGDMGNTWKTVALNNPEKLKLIQPAILNHGNGKLQALYRSMKDPYIAENFSYDYGITWTPVKLTDMPNNNSGLDAETLKDGRFLMVYNHAGIPKGRWGGPRYPLNIAISKDGKNWEAALVLEDQRGEFSYPSVIQSPDGLVHVVYTWNRIRVKHVVIDPKKLKLTAIKNGHWPDQ